MRRASSTGGCDQDIIIFEMTKFNEHGSGIPFAGLSRFGGPSPALWAPRSGMQAPAMTMQSWHPSAARSLFVSYRRTATAGLDLLGQQKTRELLFVRVSRDFLERC